MRILKYNNKLVEEVGNVENRKVCFLKYIREEDKDKCECCNRPIDREIAIVEDCLNWKESIEKVDTL